MKKLLYFTLALMLTMTLFACGEQNEEIHFSEGLGFTLAEDGTHYIVSDIGECTDFYVNIPDTYNELPVTEIGEYAFAMQTQLARITIPEGVTAIGEGAFVGCKGLSCLTIPSTVLTFHGSALASTLPLVIYNNSDVEVSAAIVFDKNGNKTYHSEDYIDTEDGFLFIRNKPYIEGEDDTFKLIAYFGDKETVTLPTNVNGKAYTLYRVRGIQNAVIPVGAECFFESSAFGDCQILKSIKIKNSVTSIGTNSFSDCGNLTTVYLPGSVTEIQMFAFSDCTNLVDIYFDGTKAQWNLINKETIWAVGSDNFTIHCTDGDVSK